MAATKVCGYSRSWRTVLGERIVLSGASCFLPGNHKEHNPTVREIVDLTGLADLLDLTRREANELACEENFPAPVEVVQGSQIWYGDDVRNWARESGRLPTAKR